MACSIAVPGLRATRTTLDAALLERIEGLRRDRRPTRVIASIVGRSDHQPGACATWPVEPQSARPADGRDALRVAPGELLQIDIKKLGRICGPVIG